MHGLRCSPSLLGWTRLLDEWVVGLTQYNRASPSESVCWEHEARTRATLASAATRVRSFAYHEAEIEPTEPRADGTLRFELQGCTYVVATVQRSPEAPRAMTEAADAWLAIALDRAVEAASPGELGTGVVLVTPKLAKGLTEAERHTIADEFVVASRLIPSDGCAYSFPDVGEIARYRYANSERPGALLLVRASASPQPISA